MAGNRYCFLLQLRDLSSLVTTMLNKLSNYIHPELLLRSTIRFIYMVLNKGASMEKWSHNLFNKVVFFIGRTATKPRFNHRGLCAAVSTLVFLLAVGSPAIWAQSFSWTERQPAGNTNKSWRRTASSSDGTKLIAGVNGGRLYISTDMGANWTERQPAGDEDKAWMCIASSSDGTKLIAGVYGGRLYTSTDTGANWIERQPAGNADRYWTCTAISSDGAKLIAGVFNGRLYTSTDTGETWTERQPAGNLVWPWECTASSSDGTNLIAGVYSGRLYTSTNAGATWTERQPAGDTEKNWYCTASSSDGTKLIAGVYSGRLYTSTDGGETWTERQPTGNTNKLWWCTASSSDGTKLIAGVCGDRLYTSTDAGATWTDTQPAGDVYQDWACAASSSDGTKLIAGAYDGRLYTGTMLVQYTLSGYVRTSDSAGIDSVLMYGLSDDPQTDTNGYYTATVDSGWSGAVTPTKAGYTFDPESTSYNGVTDNQETNYTGTFLTFTLSGHVRNTDSIGIEGVVMSGLPNDPLTDVNGFYIDTVDYGWSGTVTPTDTCPFLPESTYYDSVTSDQTDQNYVEECLSQGVEPDKEKTVPKDYQLTQNSPNPFNPFTKIDFALPKATFVTLKVYNILGQEVITLVDKNLPAGTYRVGWDGTAGSGRSVSSGVYFYRIQAGDYLRTKRMLLLK
jgi:photosystem II stability/assembly factor-like uncharacterized protein